MKKFFLIPILGIATAAFGQYYPQDGNTYPSNPQENYPQQNNPQNNNGWGDEEGVYNNTATGGAYGSDPYAYGNYNYSSADFPEDYYYNYPTDYYPQGYYQGYYNDYRNSIMNINWPGFYAQFNLNPFQIRQITILNNRFSSYGSWYGYYGMNPDRWYYDRYYALRQILGPQVFVVFQNRYFHGYTPWAYYQNYRRTYYIPRYEVMPRYRGVNVMAYRVDRNRFFENRGFIHGNMARNYPGGGGFTRNGNPGAYRNVPNAPYNGAGRFQNRGQIYQGNRMQNGGFRTMPNQAPQQNPGNQPNRPFQGNMPQQPNQRQFQGNQRPFQGNPSSAPQNSNRTQGGFRGNQGNVSRTDGHSSGMGRFFGRFSKRS